MIDKYRYQEELNRGDEDDREEVVAEAVAENLEDVIVEENKEQRMEEEFVAAETCFPDEKTDSDTVVGDTEGLDRTEGSEVIMRFGSLTINPHVAYISNVFLGQCLDSDLPTGRLDQTDMERKYEEVVYSYKPIQADIWYNSTDMTIPEYGNFTGLKDAYDNAYLTSAPGETKLSNSASSDKLLTKSSANLVTSQKQSSSESSLSKSSSSLNVQS